MSLLERYIIKSLFQNVLKRAETAEARRGSRAYWEGGTVMAVGAKVLAGPKVLGRLFPVVSKTSGRLHRREGPARARAARPGRDRAGAEPVFRRGRRRGRGLSQTAARRGSGPPPWPARRPGGSPCIAARSPARPRRSAAAR